MCIGRTQDCPSTEHWLGLVLVFVFDWLIEVVGLGLQRMSWNVASIDRLVCQTKNNLAVSAPVSLFNALVQHDVIT